MNCKKLKIPEDHKTSRWEDFNYWIWDKLKYTWYYTKFRYPLSNFKTGIKNMIKWMPIVWKDRDWDGAYILDALIFKIKNTRDRIVNNDIIEGVDEVQRYTTIAERLFTKVKNEDYLMEYSDYAPREKCTFLNGEPRPDRLDEFFNKYPRQVTLAKIYIANRLRQPEDLDNRTLVAIIVSHLRHEKANRLAFKILEEHLSNWWD